VTSRLNDHGLTRPNLIGRYFTNQTVAAHAYCIGQKIQQILNGPAPVPDGQVFQYPSHKHEAGNYRRGKELSDRQCRKQRDGHREFHRHFSLNNVLAGLLEDGISADEGPQDQSR
jgi:hypothetical protein